MTKKICWTLKETLAPVEKNIYGGFVEHLGRNVYGGVYDPGSPTADEDGFRKDVIELIKKLDTPVTRYPGGCFSDLYKWEDMVGSERKAFLDPAWSQLEPAVFGLDEFMKWAEKVETTPMITVNIANRSLIDTAALFEYCNFPGNTYWSDQRRKNGRETPYQIKYWCLGNELYGSWEMGQMSAEKYALCAREHAKVLRNLDPDCQLILCGNPSAPDWDETVLNICGSYCDYLSLHWMFVYKKDTPEQTYLRSPDEFEKAVLKTKDLIENIRSKNSDCRIKGISVDEWIIWDSDRRTRPGEKWTAGMHLLEQDYTIREALITGQIFSIFQRNADILKIACIAQSVNVIAPIRTEPDGTSWTQSIFNPFHYSSRFGRGNALKICESGNEDQDISGSAIENDDGTITLFLTNRSENTYSFSLQGTYQAVDAITLTNDDHDQTNGPDGIDHFQTKALTVEDGIHAELAPYSWSMIRVRKIQ